MRHAMKAGYYTEAELAELAREARQKSGKTQQAAADALNDMHGNGDSVKASQPVIAMAENNPERPYRSLRIAMIEAFSDYDIEGPLYRLKRKKKG